MQDSVVGRTINDLSQRLSGGRRKRFIAPTSRTAKFQERLVWLPFGPATHISSFRPAEGNERESATCKQGQHLVAPRNEIGDVVKEKLVVVFRRFVLFARNWGGQFGKVVKEKLVMLFRRFVLFARNVGRNRQNDNEGKLRPKFEWPYVMNSSVAIRGPLVSGTCIWHRQYARWHHGYYRTRR